MTLQWIVADAALLIALAACWLAWRTARRLEQLSQRYWELKYLNGELRVKLQHITGEPARSRPPAPKRRRVTRSCRSHR